MNDFTDQLDQDLEDNHFNTDEFGEDVTYRPASGSPETEIPGLYDEPYSAAGTEVEEDVNANQPHLTVRQVDIEDGRLKSGDRFVVRGQLRKPITYDGSNGQGVIRFYLQNVAG